MAAFNELVQGIVVHRNEEFDVNTTVARTILGQTEELSFLRSLKPIPDDLQSNIRNSSLPNYQGLFNPNLPKSRGKLKSAMEDLFKNFTISLLAEPYLQ